MVEKRIRTTVFRVSYSCKEPLHFCHVYQVVHEGICMHCNVNINKSAKFTCFTVRKPDEQN